MNHAEDKFLVLNGARFHYRDWARDNAPALIRPAQPPVLPNQKYNRLTAM